MTKLSRLYEQEKLEALEERDRAFEKILAEKEKVFQNTIYEKEKVFQNTIYEKEKAKIIEIAKTMLYLGDNIAKISIVTGLKEDEIKALSSM